MSDAYDLVPYTDHAYAESHPDTLAVVARLNRFEPPDLARARVLEIGCGRGGNILPMAAGMPDATFVGIDRSPVQISEAIEIARDAGLTNITLRAADFQELEDDARFDYVIAHGLLSWIAREARNSLLRTIARSLAPRGIAYVSFNVLPGWYERLAARDWLRKLASPASARASLDELRSYVSPELASYRASLDGVATRIAETDEAYVTHEYFGPEHHPQLVSDFLDEAQSAGLQYLGDAIPQETAFELCAPALAARAARETPDVAQQVLDFARNTAFRRALLVRGGDCDASGWSFSTSLFAGALAKMTVTSRLRPTSVRGELSAGDAIIQLGERELRALDEVARAAPHAAPIDAALCGPLFDVWLATRALDLHVHAPVIADGSSSQPRACPVARWHAAHGGAITNRWHHEVVLQDDITVSVLARLDGTRTRNDLAHELATTPPIVTEAISQLASLALLIA